MTSGTPARSDEATLPLTVAEAVASIRTWGVPLDRSATFHDAQIGDRLKLSVQDHVVDAVELEVGEQLPVHLDLSVGDDKTAYLAASVGLPDGKAVERRFAALMVRGGDLAQLSPVGSINLVGAGGEVIRSFAADKLARSRAAGSENRGFLIAAYIVAVLIPVLGILVALYTAVAQRRAAIRRHAIAIAGVALLAAGAYVLVITSINNANQDRNVASDLRSLLDSHAIQYDSVGACAHQGGNQYVCMVTRNGQQTPVQVTDDGKTIYEVGISANGQ